MQLALVAFVFGTGRKLFPFLTDANIAASIE